MSAPKLEDLRRGYQHLWDTMVPRGWFATEALRLAKIVRDNRVKYEEITRRTGVPWQLIAVVHNLECSLSFEKHLHNGDPLTARTVQVPKGRPLKGSPPFTFEESAVDALQVDGLTTWRDWSVPGMLYKLEGFNGFGYRGRGINTPYLWSGCQHYSRGKYVKDGVFDEDAVSKQLGAALLLKALMD